MKKLFTFIVLLMILSYSQAQTIVSTTVQNKNALIEEFTGIHCGYCPNGHYYMAQAMAANPGHVYGIAYHQGGYAIPDAGEPDYRTSFGDGMFTLMTFADDVGYPCGMVNRHLFSGYTDVAYTTWPSVCATINTETANANIAIDVDLNFSTRLLTVLVEVYYTSASAATTNYLNVALLQNNVKGIQENYGNYNPTMITPDGKYMHQHMLRHMLTGQWGTAITPTTAGSFYTTTLTYTIPASYTSIPVDLAQLEVVAFVTQSQSEVLNVTAQKVPVALDCGITSISGIGSAICSNTFTPTVTLSNPGNTTLTSATINYQLDAGTVSTYNWTGSLATGATTTLTLPTQTVSTGGSHSFTSYTSNPNGSTDLNTFNDQTVQTFSTFLTAINAPVTQNFGATAWPPTNWTFAGANSWTRNTAYGHTAVGSAFLDWYSIGEGTIDDLILDPMNFAEVINGSVSFWFAHKLYSSSYPDDQLQLDVSTDCGSTWTTLWSQTGTALTNGSALYTTSAYTAPVGTDWAQRTVSLSAYDYTPSLLLRIRGTSGYSNNLFLDDINITGTIVTGIDNQMIENVILAPNPTSGPVTISMPSVLAGDLLISIMDQSGRILHQITSPASPEARIDLSNYADGIYLIRVQNGDYSNVHRVLLQK